MFRTLSNSIGAWAAVSRVRAAILRYLATLIFMTTVIALARLGLFQGNAWVVLILAVLACSWFGGVGPSVLSPLLLVMSIRYMQKEPGHVLDFTTKELTDLGGFLLLTMALGWSGRIRRRAQELASRQAAQLLEETRRKDQFLATLAHELRNPLAPLRSGLELLQLAGADAADKSMVREVRDMMQRQVDQLVRLIDDLLDVSRINTGKIELRRERVDLALVIQEAVKASQPQMKAANHRLDVTIRDSELIVDGDAARLSQVLLNILINAAKFTHANGQIQLSAGRNGSLAEIRVRDNGIGIPPEMLPCIFDMFTQVDGSLERSHGGLGIGLSLVRNLVQMHGGTVTAHSEGLDRGSEFVIRLPLCPGAVADKRADEPMSPALNGVSRPRRILVVDDNEDAARSLARLLAGKGHRCQLAFRGTDALKAVQEFQPEAVILDIGMPEMNGYEVVGQLRAMPRGDRLVLIAVTGWGQENDRRRSAEAGFDHHLVKPVEIDALQGLLAAEAAP